MAMAVSGRKLAGSLGLIVDDVWASNKLMRVAATVDRIFIVLPSLILLTAKE